MTEELLSQIAAAAQHMNPWEVLAVTLAVIYLLLAMRLNIWCWAAGFASTAIYLVLFWEVSLLSESLLQVFYLGMSLYGWWQWRGGLHHHNVAIRHWTQSRHTRMIGLTLLVTLGLGYIMDHYTPAAFPYLDAFTTCFAVLTTYMVAHKILENWLYWIVIDSVSIFLYASRSLYLTALLFVFYVALSIVGYRAWRRDYHEQLLACPT